MSGKLKLWVCWIVGVFSMTGSSKIFSFLDFDKFGLIAVVVVLVATSAVRVVVSVVAVGVIFRTLLICVGLDWVVNGFGIDTSGWLAFIVGALLSIS